MLVDDSALTTQDEEKTMEDTIRETMAAMENGTHGKEPEPEEVEPEIEEVAEVEAEPAEPELEAEEAEEVAAEPVSKAPSSLKKEVQAKWDKLDPDVRSEFERREKDFHKGIENYKQAAQAASEWEKTISPYVATVQSLGVTPQQAVQHLFAADHALRYGSAEQKQQLFRKLAQDYGVDLAGVSAPQESFEYVDPTVQSLQQRVAQFEGYIQQQQMTQQQQEAQQLNSTIAEFSKDKPHFEALREDMAALLQAGRATDLQDAYDKALWANPTTRADLLAKQQAEQRKLAAKKAQEAKKAGVNVSSRGAIPAGKPNTGSIEDTIRAEAQRLNMI